MIIILYTIGLAAMLLVFLPFSPMTIDLVNFSRNAQITVYRYRHLLWAIGNVCLGIVLWRSAVSLSDADIGKWFWITLATIGVLAMLFWSGYVPFVMAPPGRQHLLTAEEADRVFGPDEVIIGLVHGGCARICT